MSDQVIPEGTPYTTQQTQETNVPVSEGFGPAIPAISRPYTYVLDRTVTRICLVYDTTL